MHRLVWKTKVQIQEYTIKTRRSSATHCREENFQRAATHYCREWCGYLCQYCEGVHEILRITQNHHSVMIKTHMKLVWIKVMLLCSCGMKHAVFYCPLHDDLMCSGCNTRDHTGCEANLITALARWNRSENDIDTKKAKINF